MARLSTPDGVTFRSKLGWFKWAPYANTVLAPERGLRTLQYIGFVLSQRLRRDQWCSNPSKIDGGSNGWLFAVMHMVQPMSSAMPGVGWGGVGWGGGGGGQGLVGLLWPLCVNPDPGPKDFFPSLTNGGALGSISRYLRLAPPTGPISED